MKTIEERNKEFYTEKGLGALKERFGSWAKIFNENIFPRSGKMLGFGDFYFNDKQECMARIKELMEILGPEIKVQREVIKNNDQTETIKETIKWQAQ